MTSPYPSIPVPVNTPQSIFNCLLQMRQILSLLVVNVQPISNAPISAGAQIFSTEGSRQTLEQIVVIQNANLTALQAQVDALEAELATPLSVYGVPAPSQTLHHLSTAGNHLLQTGHCTFAGFSVNTGQASATMTLYDGVDATGTLLGVFDCAVADEGMRRFDWALTNGCFVVIVGTPDLTVALQ
jgi:hypothetical protein